MSYILASKHNSVMNVVVKPVIYGVVLTFTELRRALSCPGNNPGLNAT